MQITTEHWNEKRRGSIRHSGPTEEGWYEYYTYTAHCSKDFIQFDDGIERKEWFDKVVGLKPAVDQLLKDAIANATSVGERDYEKALAEFQSDLIKYETDKIEHDKIINAWSAKPWYIRLFSNAPTAAPEYPARVSNVHQYISWARDRRESSIRNKYGVIMEFPNTYEKFIEKLSVERYKNIQTIVDELTTIKTES